MRGQQVREAADLAPAHRVGLAGERERPGARAADLAGGQVQVDQRRVVGRALRALVQALAVQRQHRRRRRPTSAPRSTMSSSRRPRQRARSRAACTRARGRATPRSRSCARAMKRVVGQALPQHQVQQAVEQRDVGAGQDLQVQVGHRGGLGACADRRRSIFCAGRAAFASSRRRHRIGMRPREVAAGDEDEVGVGRGRRSRPAARRRRASPCSPTTALRHAQARVGVDVVGAQQALGELVEDVVVLGQQLARDVEADRVGAVRAHGVGEAVGERRRAPRPSRSPSAPRRAARAASAAAGAPARATCGAAVRCSVLPLVHRRPKLAGCSGSPRTSTMRRRLRCG